MTDTDPLPPGITGKVAFQTPWFRVIAQETPGPDHPHYAIQAPDVAMVLGLNPEGHLLLVRQFRPAVNMDTLELPSGHIEPGDTPEETARKELCEETGYEGDRFEFLTTFSPSVGRFTNKHWLYFAPDLRLAKNPAYPPEPDLTAIFHTGSIRSLLEIPEFFSAPNYAALFVALAMNKIKL